MMMKVRYTKEGRGGLMAEEVPFSFNIKSTFPASLIQLTVYIFIVIVILTKL